MSYIGNTPEYKSFPERLVENFEATGTGPYDLSKTVPGGYAGNIEVFYSGPVVSGKREYNRLRPQIDYAITGSGVSTNKQLSLQFTPTTYTPGSPELNDIFFVIHDSSATYSLVPSPGSVSADSLQLNLREFTVDSFLGVTDQTDFILSKTVPTSSSILVFVDGVYKAGAVDTSKDYLISGNNTLVFNTAPTTDQKIQVIHLSFSTTSSYTNLSELGNNSVGTVHLIDGAVTADKLASNSVTTAKILDANVTRDKITNFAVDAGKLATDAITTIKIQDGAVTSGKIADDGVKSGDILLENNTGLRIKNAAGVAKSVVKIDGSDIAHLGGDSGIERVVIDVNGSSTIAHTANTIEPETNLAVSCGSDSKRWSNVKSALGDFTGNLTVGGTVDGVDISALKAVLDLYFPNGTTQTELIPPGTISMFGGSVVPDGYLLCNGAEVSKVTYARLWAAIGGQIYGTPVDSVTNFLLPDMRNRFVIGAGTGNTIGTSDSIAETSRSPKTHTHTHTHTHDIAAISNVYLPNHTHTVSVTGNIAHTHDHDHQHYMHHVHGVWGHSHYTGQIATMHDGAHGHTGNIGSNSINTSTVINNHPVRGNPDGARPLRIESPSSEHSHQIAPHWTIGGGFRPNDPNGVYCQRTTFAIAANSTVINNDNLSAIPFDAGAVQSGDVLSYTWGLDSPFKTTSTSSVSNVTSSGTSGNPTSNPAITIPAHTTSSHSAATSTQVNALPHVSINYIIKF